MTRAQSGKLKFSGIIKDTLPADCPPGVWTDGRNVQFRAGKTERVPGEAPFADAFRLFDADRDWHIDSGATKLWFYAGATAGGSIGVAATNGAVHWDITPIGWAAIASAAKVLTIGDLNGVFWINHPELGPFWWDGDVAHKMTALPGWPVNWSVDVMRAHKNWMFGFALDDGTLYHPGRWVSSTGAEAGLIPSEWLPTPENDAADGDMNVPTGPILDAISVNDALFVMKRKYTGVLQYVGGQFVWRQKDVFPSMGIFSTGACVEAGNMVYMLTGDRQLIRHDGTSFADILYGKLQDYVTQQINYERAHIVFMYQDLAAGQVMLCYPAGAAIACTEAVSIEVASGDAGIRDLPGIYGVALGETLVVPQGWDDDEDTWQDDDTIWNENATGFAPASLVFAAGPEGLLQQGAAATQWTPDGPALLPANVSRTGIDFDDLDGRKSIMGLVPLINGANGDVISFQIGSQDTSSGPVTLDPAQAYVLGVDDHVDAQIDGRFAAMYVSSLGGLPWQLGTLAPLVSRRGRW